MDLSLTSWKQKWNSQPAQYRKVIRVVENKNTNRKYGGMREALFLHIYPWNERKLPRPSFAAWYGPSDSRGVGDQRCSSLALEAPIYPFSFPDILSLVIFFS